MANTLDLFLELVHYDTSIRDRFWMGYELPNGAGGKCQVGKASEHDETIAQVISDEIKRLIGQSRKEHIIFRKAVIHNGSSDDVPEYDGFNEGILANKLSRERYDSIYQRVRQRYFGIPVLRTLSG